MSSAPQLEHGGEVRPKPFAPYIPAATALPEFTFRAVLLGALLGMVFGASSLYLVLKVAGDPGTMSAL